MTNAEEQRKMFWDMYKEFLINNGEPFFITEGKQWAIVNKESSSWNNPCLAMDFLSSKKILRVNIFILNDIKLYEHLKTMKNELDEGFYPLKPEWVEGTKGKTARRIKIEIQYSDNNIDEYERIIEISSKYILNFIEKYRPFIEC